MDPITETACVPVSKPESARPASSCQHVPCDGWMRTAGPGSGARWRIGVILSVILALYIGLSLRLAQIQVGQGTKWAKRAEQQRVVQEMNPGQRGPISDRTNLPLAFCQPCDTIIADLKILKEPATAAKKLAPILGIAPEALMQKMARDDVRVVYLKRHVAPEVADKIRALKIRGIGFEDEFRRTYPQGSLACHILGFSGIDGGKEGLELELNSILSGTPGYLRYYRDAARRLIALNDGAIGPGDSRPPRDGLSITLTIDARIQHMAEQQLAKVMEEFQPTSATCTVMDVSNGAILAMACVPSFDPNQPAQFPAESRRNRIITDVYEPGSTFKTFAAAMALEKKLWRRSESIHCENGAWRLGYRTLHDSHAYATLSFDDVIAKSSNIGAAKIAMRLGTGGLYETVIAFGFGDETDIHLPGEVRGLVRSKKVWTNDSIYSVAMGHEVGVTPLQLVAAYAAVVNGGVLYRPKIVQRIVNEKGEELYSLHPQPLRRVISEATSQQMREILAKVVQPGGTGMKAFCAEWAIGGKTGTTKKIDPVTRTYSSTHYIGSFCGFAPADNPRIVCLVTVDEPHKSAGYYGGTVACPAAREVLKKGMMVLNVPPKNADEQKKAITDARRTVAEAPARGSH
ncbi:MAG TPA: penicillin-binding protein 2 [Planctomycetota bacterium]|nr:penicillin-binding protein 2 [Planctomycetota bacterium]